MFIGTNFFPQDNPVDLPKGFYEEKTLELYRKIKEDYYLPFSEAAKILRKSDIDVERLFNVVKRYYVGQDRLKYLSILAPLGLTIYGLNECWPRSAYYDFDIAASFDNTPISTLKDNQRVYNTSKVSVNNFTSTSKKFFFLEGDGYNGFSIVSFNGEKTGLGRIIWQIHIKEC